MKIHKTFQIEAAHLLPNVPEEHKCRRLHGHSYRITVYVEGPLDPTLGWVVDFADISTAFAPVFERLDHRYLNEIPGLENPTAENIAIWVWDALADRLPGLNRVEIAETCTSGCVYDGK